MKTQSPPNNFMTSCVQWPSNFQMNFVQNTELERFLLGIQILEMFYFFGFGFGFSVFFFLPQLAGSQLSNQGSNLCLLQWQHDVLTGGSPGNSQKCFNNAMHSRKGDDAYTRFLLCQLLSNAVVKTITFRNSKQYKRMTRFVCAITS